jgi:hypothetical protein
VGVFGARISRYLLSDKDIASPDSKSKEQASDPPPVTHFIAFVTATSCNLCPRAISSGPPIHAASSDSEFPSFRVFEIPELQAVRTQLGLLYQKEQKAGGRGQQQQLPHAEPPNKITLMKCKANRTH